MIWFRHLTLCTKFCAVSQWRSETRLTACGGSIDALDLGEFEADENPPAELRCGACERALCDAGPINRGLRELVANSPEQVVPVVDDSQLSPAQCSREPASIQRCHTGGCPDPREPSSDCGPYGWLCNACRDRTGRLVLRLTGKLPTSLAQPQPVQQWLADEDAEVARRRYPKLFRQRVSAMERLMSASAVDEVPTPRAFDDSETEIVDVDGFECGGEA